MSLIARQRWDGRIVLFCKGADTVMLARSREGQAITESIEAHLVRGRCRAGGLKPLLAGCPGFWCVGVAGPGA